MSARKRWVCVADAKPLPLPAKRHGRADSEPDDNTAPEADAVLDCVKILRLLHPRTKKLSPFMVINDRICELQFVEPPTDDELKDGLCSWFVGNCVVSDGRITMASQVDPLFLALPHLMKNGARYSPLSQILVHPEAVHTRMIAKLGGIYQQLRHLCDVNDKHGPDCVFYRWNEAKTLKWLKRKVENVATLFMTDPSLANGMCSSSSTKGLQFCKDINTQDSSGASARSIGSKEPKLAAWDMALSIISAYVDPEVSGKLQEALQKDGKILEKRASLKKRVRQSSSASATYLTGSHQMPVERHSSSNKISAKDQLMAIMNQRPEAKAAIGSLHGPAKKKAKIASKPVPKGQKSVFSFFSKMPKKK